MMMRRKIFCIHHACNTLVSCPDEREAMIYPILMLRAIPVDPSLLSIVIELLWQHLSRKYVLVSVARSERRKRDVRNRH